MTGTFCSQQDELFALSFDWMGVVGASGTAFFLVPLLLAFAPPLWWWMTAPRRRWIVSAVLLGALALTFFVMMPMMAGANMIDPGVGLIAYPGVDVKYATGCPNLSFQSTPLLFGRLSASRSAAIVRSYDMLIAFVVGVGLWSLLFYVVFVLIRRRKGLAAGLAR